MLFKRGWALTVGAALIATPVWSQAVPVNALSQAEATFRHGFTRVENVRELSDGGVILLDVADGSVYAIDHTWTAMWQIGRSGDGPGEYRSPVMLFALSHDSSVVYDRQNSRMLVITPDGEPGGFLSPLGSAGRSRTLYPTLRQSETGIGLNPVLTADGRGYYYTLAEPLVPTPEGDFQPVDSAAIERWTAISDRRDTVAFVPTPEALERGSTIFSGRLATEPKWVAFRPSYRWAVAHHGRVAVVYYDPYRVRFYGETGAVVDGPPVSYEPVRVTDVHKELLLEKMQQGRPAVVVSSDGRAGVVSMAPSVPVDLKWPKYLPPFGYTGIRSYYPSVHFTSDGMLWVLRTTPLGEPQTFDVFDRTGRVVEQIKLPDDRRLVGFGDGTLYAVRIDEVDLEYLERYRLP
jgi:hypothetical protein